MSSVFFFGFFVRLFVCSAHGFGELVGAGGVFAAAGDAGEEFFNFAYGLADDDFADGFEVAVAAAVKYYIDNCFAVEGNFDGGGADAAFCFIDVCHDFDSPY